MKNVAGALPSLAERIFDFFISYPPFALCRVCDPLFSQTAQPLHRTDARGCATQSLVDTERVRARVVILHTLLVLATKEFACNFSFDRR